MTHEREREWSPEFAKLIQSLLVFKPDRRVSSLSQLRRQRLMSNVNFASVLQRRWPPPYVPAGEGRRLHCDPALELEEMIVEANPLHKKKKRLQRQQTLLTQKALQQAQMQTLTVVSALKCCMREDREKKIFVLVFLSKFTIGGTPRPVRGLPHPQQGGGALPGGSERGGGRKQAVGGGAATAGGGQEKQEEEQLSGRGCRVSG